MACFVAHSRLRRWRLFSPRDSISFTSSFADRSSLLKSLSRGVASDDAIFSQFRCFFELVSIHPCLSLELYAVFDPVSCQERSSSTNGRVVASQSADSGAAGECRVCEAIHGNYADRRPRKSEPMLPMPLLVLISQPTAFCGADRERDAYQI